MDLFPTLTRIAGAKLPTDRTIDGVDQSSFFLGKTEKSNREGFVVYVGESIFGAKWRNWKVMNKELDTQGGPIKEYGIPASYDLHLDPKEEHPLDPRTPENFWVRFPIAKILAEHAASLQREPPIHPGTLDPYIPPK
jgi:arylsulfatase